MQIEQIHVKHRQHCDPSSHYKHIMFQTISHCFREFHPVGLQNLPSAAETLEFPANSHALFIISRTGHAVFIK